MTFCFYTLPFFWSLVFSMFHYHWGNAETGHMRNLIKLQIFLEIHAIYSCKLKLVQNCIDHFLDPYLKWTPPFSSFLSSAEFLSPFSNLPFLEEDLGSSLVSKLIFLALKCSLGLVSFHFPEKCLFSWRESENSSNILPLKFQSSKPQLRDKLLWVSPISWKVRHHFVLFWLSLAL